METKDQNSSISFVFQTKQNFNLRVGFGYQIFKYEIDIKNKKKPMIYGNCRLYHTLLFSLSNLGHHFPVFLLTVNSRNRVPVYRFRLSLSTSSKKSNVDSYCPELLLPLKIIIVFAQMERARMWHIQTNLK